MTPKGLLNLVNDLGRARQADTTSALARLRTFLQRARPLLGATKILQGLQRPLPTASRLREILLIFRPRLESARAAGEFINVWAVAGLSRNEVRNAAVLAWFIEPSGTHGLGPAVIRELLGCAAAHRGWAPYPLDVNQAHVRTELRPQGSEKDRIDIAVETSDHVLFIEVKIDAGEQNEQLARYAAAAAAIRKDWRLIFLSPAAPRSLPAGAVWLTWRDVAAALNVAADAVPVSLGRLLLLQFAKHARAFS